MSSSRLFKAALLALICVCADTGFAQETDNEPNPIKWSIKNNASKPVKAGNRFVVELTAQIENGWHLYSTERVEGGPTPTRISIPSGQSFEISGEIDSPAPRSSYDPNFQLATDYYEGSVLFTIPVRALANSNKLSVQVRYQTCTQAICLAPKLLELETQIQIAGVAADPGQSETRTEVERATEALAAGAMVPDFSFTDFTGKTRHFSEYRGRYVLLDFWASWCSPCLADIPHLKETHLKYRDRGFEILGMDSETLGQAQVEPDFARDTQARAREIVNTRGVT
ncbi:MAG TPA: protein-disulfide reductase DsbD domain-containing protein, partial [Pyrinomonadaceae bacterium]|nr:protein-disulfide reductase DsbD domain-containing protein [Pyrinomonadaceae bacterium]